MLDIAALFGDKDALTKDELTEALKDKKLVDLEEGGYVSKEKFAALEKAKNAEIGDLKAKVDEAAKAANQDGGDKGLEAKLAEALEKIENVSKAQAAAEAKATRLEREKMVASKVANPKLAKLALMEAESMTDDDTSFEDALAKVIEGDDDYKAAAPSADAGGARMKTGEHGKGGGKTADDDDSFAAFEASATKNLPKDDTKE